MLESLGLELNEKVHESALCPEIVIIVNIIVPFLARLNV